MRPFVQRLVLASAAMMLLAGHMLPWAAHKTAALTLSGHELAAFTNFTPGAGVFLNEWFYLPLWASALMLSAAIAASASRLARIMGAALAAGVASLGLPSYPQVLTAYGNPDYRLQFLASLAVMAIAAAFTLGRVTPWRLKEPRLGALWIAGLAVAAAVPLGGYLVVKPFLEQLYRDTLGLGGGWWLTLLGVGTALSLAAWRMLKSV